MYMSSPQKYERVISIIEQRGTVGDDVQSDAESLKNVSLHPYDNKQFLTQLLQKLSKLVAPFKEVLDNFPNKVCIVLGSGNTLDVSDVNTWKDIQ
jgi:UDP-galactopyranose mutase